MEPPAGLASGFGIKCRMVGARGQDEQGAIFVSSLKRAGVDTSRLRVGRGSTGARSGFPSASQRRKHVARQAGTCRVFSVNGIMQDDDVCLRVAHVRMQAGASF